MVERNAYTIWFVYFDQPAACQSTPCAAPDVSGDDPLGVVSRLDSAIADGGLSYFSGTIRSLRLSPGSEVHLGVFDHGPANLEDFRYLARQLLTPQVPSFGAPMGGAPTDGNKGAPARVAILTVP